jgi:chemotaxis signal transduction protein
MINKLTRVPQSTYWFPGTLSHGDRQIPVIDVLARITERPRQPTLSDLVIICRDQTGQVGFIVQEVYGSYPCMASLIERPRAGLASAPFLLGTFQLDERPMLLFNTSILSAGSGYPEAQA